MGSSPRGRGKHVHAFFQHVHERLIPARAGKTSRKTAASSTSWAHPRAGGENDVMRRVDAPLTGSSPRGRGKPIVTLAAFTVARLIPARAGKTPAVASRASGAWAHPRAGGENDGDEADPMSIHGSSPRGRGKRPPTGLGRSYRWLIPARAGKTCGEASAAGSDWAHPRAGGENSNISVALSAQPGSSPRGRGKLYRENTAFCAPGAHPRAGGENHCDDDDLTLRFGSSPRGRGNPPQRRHARLDAWLIPARAGKTGGATRAKVPSRAHPRAGGENAT